MKRILLVFMMIVMALNNMLAQQHVVTLPSGATLEVYLPSKSKANGRCVLITPGGAYHNLSVDGEGRRWAPWLTERGYVMAMLSYRMPQGNYSWPLQDGREAMALLREKGEAWRIKNGCVGVMGFSAGGHLASTIATKTHGDERPAFQILFYPVITMDPSYTHANSRTNLLGSNPSAELEDMFSNEKQVESDNPPCFICYPADDNVVPIANSQNYYKALVEHNVPATIKEYPKGGHGFGFNTSFAYHNDMLNELENWLHGLNEYLYDDADVDKRAWTDVTADYIANPGFEECAAYAGNVMVTNPPKGNSPDYASNGWKLEQMSDWCCSAVMEYGSQDAFSVATICPPLSDNEGNAGKALAISIGRTYQIRYVSASDITLPAGHYRLSAWCTNQNTDAFTEFHSLLGFVPNEGDAFLSSLSGVVPGKWTQDVVEFTLNEPVTGRIQVGGKGINTNKPSTEHAKVFIDNLTLECLPELDALINQAVDMELPEANVGDAAFQYPAAPIEQFKAGLQNALQVYEQYKNGEEVDLEAMEKELRDVINAYEAVKDSVNLPAAGKRYKLMPTFDWSSFDAQFEPLTGAVLTLSLHATQAVPGTYILGIGPSSHEKFTDEPYLAQAFFFVPVEGVHGGFKLGITDEEGVVRYACSGQQYAGGNSLQIRTITDESKALTLRVIPTEKEGVIQLRSTACNINLSFRDYAVYCWSEMTNRSDGFRLKEVDEMANIALSLHKGEYATCMFPFSVNADGVPLTEFFSDYADKLEVFSCFGTQEGDTILELTPVTELMANTPYIVKALEDVDVCLSGYGTAIAPVYSYGWLVGNYSKESNVPAGGYVLRTMPEGGQGFYKIEDTESSILPYQAYLALPESISNETSVMYLQKVQKEDDSEQKEDDSEQKEDGPSTGLVLVNGTDGWKNVVNVYDVMGRKSSLGQKGLHIVRMSDGTIKKHYIR